MQLRIYSTLEIFYLPQDCKPSLSMVCIMHVLRSVLYGSWSFTRLQKFKPWLYVYPNNKIVCRHSTETKDLWQKIQYFWQSYYNTDQRCFRELETSKGLWKANKTWSLALINLVLRMQKVPKNVKLSWRCHFYFFWFLKTIDKTQYQEKLFVRRIVLQYRRRKSNFWILAISSGNLATSATGKVKPPMSSNSAIYPLNQRIYKAIYEYHECKLSVASRSIWVRNGDKQSVEFETSGIMKKSTFLL